jgi:hypothetical protein
MIAKVVHTAIKTTLRPNQFKNNPFDKIIIYKVIYYEVMKTEYMLSQCQKVKLIERTRTR